MNHPALKILLLITALALAGCGGDDSDNGDNDNDDSGGGNNNSTYNYSGNSNQLTISLTGVVTLVEQENATEVTTRSLTRNTDNIDTTFNTNLFGLDEAGNITYPLHGTDINVSLIVPGPETYDANNAPLGSRELWVYSPYNSNIPHPEYSLWVDEFEGYANQVLQYIADNITDNGDVSLPDGGSAEMRFSNNPDNNFGYQPESTSFSVIEQAILGNDYARFEELRVIVRDSSDSNCQLIRINMTDNSYDCPIGSNSYLDTYSNDNFKAIRFDLRPIQFDANNDIYLIIDGTLTKLDRGDNYAQTSLTPDNERVRTFALLPTGEIVFNSDAGTGLRLLQNGSIYTINSDEAASYDYTLDYGNTIINDNQYIRPRLGGGFNRAPVAHGSAWQPGDDGALYGWSKRTYGDLLRLLPYTPTPIIKDVSYDDAGKLKLAQNFAYYTTTKTHSNYGDYDIISLTNLTTREETVLFDATTAEFDGGAPRYDIFNFNVSGTTLVFSALNQSNNEVKLGQIDMIKLRQGAAESEYLSFIDVSSAVSASNSVRNMVSLKPRQPSFDPGSAPYVEKYHYSNINPYSLGINFSKYMNKASVEQNLSLLDSGNSNAAVEYIPFWIQQNMFLIPDTSAGGFSDTDSAPLKLSNQYQLSLGSNTLDAYGWMLSDGDTSSYPLSTNLHAQFRTGFFQADQAPLAASTNAVSEGSVAMIDKRKNNRTNFYDDYYDLGVNVSGNVRIEFSITSRSPISLYVADTNYDHIANTGAISNYSGGVDVRISTGLLCYYLIYKKTSSLDSNAENRTMNNSPPPCDSREKWLRYRLDLFDTKVRWSYSNDGTTYTSILDETDINDLLNRNSVGNRTLVLKTSFLGESLDSWYLLLDNIKIQRLNNDGSLADTAIPANTLLDLNFDDDLKVSSYDVEGDNKGFDDEVGARYGASN